MSCDTLLAFGEITRIDLIKVAYFLVALYLSISVHEAAHAWMANRCGDDTARLMGRMTLNPIVHIDPIGTVLMPLLMVITPLLMPGGGLGIPLFGWAKPVPVNPLRFRDMRKGEVLVSLAGPVSNFILAAGALAACWIVIAALGAASSGMVGRIGEMVLLFLTSLMMLNLVLGLFNLIPIPPLDGSHILGVFLSREAAAKLERFLVPPLNFIILIFVVLPVVRPVFWLVSRAADYLIWIWWL